MLIEPAAMEAQKELLAIMLIRPPAAPAASPIRLAYPVPMPVLKVALARRQSKDFVVDDKRVRDIMLPLEEYAVVPEDATFRDALLALEKAQQNLPPGCQPHRAVLVADRDGRIVGKVGQLGFLRALEPKYRMFGDLNKLAQAGLTPEFLTRMMEELQFWQDSLATYCGRAVSVRVREFMSPVTERIREDAPLSEAIHRTVMWQTLSILVVRGDRVVGIVRLADLFTEVANHVKAEQD